MNLINCRFIALTLVSLFFVACDKKDVDIVPDSLYSVITTEGEGFVVFETTSDNRWIGTYYLSEGQLMAVKRTVDLEIGKELSLIDEAGKEIPVISYSRYEEPEFREYPETWTYRDSVYSVTVNKDVVYGSAQGYWISYPDSGGTYQEIYDAKQQELEQGKKEQELTMDVYIPEDGKEATRPLLVLIHGGAFFNGDKADPGFPEWARDLASMGYVVASVNYRLGFRKNLASVKRAGFHSVQDVDAAIRYIIHHKDIYAVDPDRVFVAGTSAGAITALNLAFMRDKDIPSEAQDEEGVKSEDPEMNELYNIRAVGNLWGAVNDLSMLNNAPTSVISFHSSGDPVVPFGKGHPFEKIFLNWLLFPTMYGSEQITQHLGNQRSTLIRYDLPERHTLHIDKDENGGIVLNFRFHEIESAMRDFFSDAMLSSPAVMKHSGNSPVFQVLSSDLDSLYWQVKGGVILKQTDCRADVLLFPDAALRSVVVCGKYKSGLTFRHQWNL